MTTGNKADRSNTSEYKRSPGTGDAASTPKTGDSFDEKWIFCIVGSSFRWKFYILEKEEKTLVILGTKPLRNTEDKVQ